MNATKSIAAGLVTLTAIGALSTASAQGYRQPTGGGVGSIFNCDAPGNKQAGGAIIGALVGGLAGREIAGRGDRGVGTVVGAAAGAAGGSYVGCKIQRDKAGRASYGRGLYAATTTVNVREAPTTSALRVDRLTRGERFEALDRQGDWILVGQRGEAIGYVHGAYVQPL